LRNDDAKVDHLKEDWTTIIPPIEVPNGESTSLLAVLILTVLIKLDAVK
jgi:hypothetical protein